MIAVLIIQPTAHKVLHNQNSAAEWRCTTNQRFRRKANQKVFGEIGMDEERRVRCLIVYIKKYRGFCSKEGRSTKNTNTIQKTVSFTINVNIV